MKKIFSCILIAMNSTVFAQESFDIINYTAPKGWKKQNTESAVQLTQQDEVGGTYCIITLMKSIPVGHLQDYRQEPNDHYRYLVKTPSWLF